MAINPTDSAELQKAPGDAAGKASALWTAFIIFLLYLAIAFGSVTQRDLFLENANQAARTQCRSALSRFLYRCSEPVGNLSLLPLFATAGFDV